MCLAFLAKYDQVVPSETKDYMINNIYNKLTIYTHHKSKWDEVNCNNKQQEEIDNMLFSGELISYMTCRG